MIRIRQEKCSILQIKVEEYEERNEDDSLSFLLFTGKTISKERRKLK